jgi:hypothetical protein
MNVLTGMYYVTALSYHLPTSLVVGRHFETSDCVLWHALLRMFWLAVRVSPGSPFVTQQHQWHEPSGAVSRCCHSQP